MVKSFADIPAEVRRRVDAGERVVLILLDALGLEFLERHRDQRTGDSTRPGCVAAKLPVVCRITRAGVSRRRLICPREGRVSYRLAGGSALVVEQKSADHGGGLLQPYLGRGLLSGETLHGCLLLHPHPAFVLPLPILAGDR